MATVQDAREALRDYFEAKQEWRESVAERYPDDARNAEWAHDFETLAEMAMDSEQIPDDHTVIVTTQAYLHDLDIEVIIDGDEDGTWGAWANKVTVEYEPWLLEWSRLMALSVMNSNDIYKTEERGLARLRKSKEAFMDSMQNEGREQGRDWALNDGSWEAVETIATASALGNVLSIDLSDEEEIIVNYGEREITLTGIDLQHDPDGFMAGFCEGVTEIYNRV